MSGIRFGINVSVPAAEGIGPVELALAAESLGFDWVSASDHLHGASSTYEPWTLLSVIAGRTSRLAVASRVLAVPYRHPPVVAKMAETLDRLSGGRTVLGLGGGYSDQEFRAFGLGVPSPREKIDRLEEAIRLIRALWSEELVTFEGRHYRTEDAELEPKPGHRIPIWLGTYGDRALRVTGRRADGWIPTLEVAGPDRLPAMRDRVLGAAAEAGRDPDEVECILNVDVRVDERARPGDSVVAGPPDAVTDQLLRFVTMGFTAVSFLPVAPGLEEQAERLGTEVVPAVRAAG